MLCSAACDDTKVFVGDEELVISADVTIKNINFKGDGKGKIRLIAGSPVIEYCDFDHCSLEIEGKTTAKITRCFISHADSPALIVQDSANPTVSNCYVYHNKKTV